MDKTNKDEVINNIQKAIMQENQFENPNKNSRIYPEELVEMVNRQFKENNFSLMIENPGDEKILIAAPRIIYNYEKSTPEILSFSVIETMGKFSNFE